MAGGEKRGGEGRGGGYFRLEICVSKIVDFLNEQDSPGYCVLNLFCVQTNQRYGAQKQRTQPRPQGFSPGDEVVKNHYSSLSIL